MSEAITGRGFAIRFTTTLTGRVEVHFMHLKPDQFAIFRTGKAPQKLYISQRARAIRAMNEPKFELMLGMTSDMPGLLISTGTSNNVGLGPQSSFSASMAYVDRVGYAVQMLALWGRTRNDLNIMLFGAITERYKSIGLPPPGDLSHILAPE